MWQRAACIRQTWMQLPVDSCEAPSRRLATACLLTGLQQCSVCTAGITPLRSRARARLLHRTAPQHSAPHSRPAEPVSSSSFTAFTADASTPSPLIASSASSAHSASAPHSYADTLHLPQSSFTAHFKASVREPELSSICSSALYAHQLQQPLLQPDLSYSASPPLFVLHDGPPFANGRLHIGHFLNKTLKDIVNRHALLTGHRVLYVSGWDCHGLPIELKALAAAPAAAAASLSPLDIRRTARAFALAAIEEQKAEFQRWGVLTDWHHTYRTMDAEYEADQLLVLLAMMQRGLIYRALKPVHWSPASRTALAEAELEYRDEHVSDEVYCFFPLVDGELRQRYGSDELSVAIWTTTPWTLPANVAIAYHPEVEYVLVEQQQQNASSGRFLVAKERVSALETRLSAQLRIVASVSAASLSSAVCKHPFLDRRSPLIPAQHVTTDIGTGFVHSAPAHGVEDFIACSEAGLHALISIVDADGRYTDDAPASLRGLAVLDGGNAAVLSLLSASSCLLLSSRFTHRYPYDWRSKTPVITRATTQWFARLDELQDAALRALDAVRFTPESGRARLRGMLGGRKEWCISRQRVWGVPIPVFYRDDGEVLMTEESVRWVTDMVRREGSDVWWEKDESELLAPAYRNDGHSYRKGADTLDVWFDSGSSWKSGLRAVQQLRQRQSASTSAASGSSSSDPQQFDVYLEGSDQHRGWFQSSLLTAVAANGCPPFRSIVTHGFVLDEAGRKMSKSLGNVVEPKAVIDGAPASAAAKKGRKRAAAAASALPFPSSSPFGGGVDLLRLWVASIDYTSDASIGPASLSKVGDVQRKIRSLARFMLGSLSSWTPATSLPLRELYGIDRYVLSLLEDWARRVDTEYRDGRYNRVYQHLLHLLSVDLSAFYFELCKDRLYADAADSRQRRAVLTVIAVALETVTKAIAPILPHTAEDIYQHGSNGLQTAFNDVLAPPAPLPAGGLNSVFTHGWLSILSASSSLQQQKAKLRRERGGAEEQAAELRHYALVRRLRSEVNRLLEVARHAKKRGAEAETGAEGVEELAVEGEGTMLADEAVVTLSLRTGSELHRALQRLEPGELSLIMGVSSVQVTADAMSASSLLGQAQVGGLRVSGVVKVECEHEQVERVRVRLTRTRGVKCPRCWRYTHSQSKDALCARCVAVLQQRAASMSSSA